MKIARVRAPILVSTKSKYDFRNTYFINFAQGQLVIIAVSLMGCVALEADAVSPLLSSKSPLLRNLSEESKEQLNNLI